ncbi:MAG: hypothetical protein B6243_07790 [Anaerolineaceae bacterium 4572_5.2]|nr:MAG: hypothetical protein B6243_07790 [Anaerolineaceae bacterium 4572_5.2]
MQLTPLDPQALTIFASDRDLLRDLFAYLDYVDNRDIKRMTRSNEISRTDMKRLLKQLGGLPIQPDENQIDGSQWLEFIDELALRLNLVFYDIKGEYRGYTSSGPSFIENYITILEDKLQKFSELSPAAQEKRILNTLASAKSFSRYDSDDNNEFFKYSVVGQLDRFSSRGSATGLMPTLKFKKIRLFLLELLNELPVGQWFSTNSLIEYLKNEHPYFLIPQNAPKKDRWGHRIGRYDNFYESKDHYGRDAKTVPPDAPDAFERVEGRYIERFLENIPLIMRFVEVAYDPQPYTGRLPSRGQLKAFRITERFRHLMSGQETESKVTVQPNFDVIIESDFYPAALITQISALGKQVSSPHNGSGTYVGIFLLNKTSVAAAQVQDTDLDVVELLKNLSRRDLPTNVQIELEEWAGHADQFTLYDGFALLEMADPPPESEKHIVERVAPDLNLVRDPQTLFSTLELFERAPVRITHSTGEFARVPEASQSRFPKESEKVEEKAQRVRVAKMVTISYQFPDPASFQAIQKMLAELRCPFQADPVTYTVNIHQSEQNKFDKAVKKLADTFVLEIE